MEGSPFYLKSRSPVISDCALSIKLSCGACFCLRKRKWHIWVFKYIWTPAGNCYRVEKERRRRLAESKRPGFFSFLPATEREGSDRLTRPFHFQGGNLQFKTCYHYTKDIPGAHTRTQNSILCVQNPLAGLHFNKHSFVTNGTLWCKFMQAYFIPRSFLITRHWAGVSPFKSNHRNYAMSVEITENGRGSMKRPPESHCLLSGFYTGNEA